jgi:hypothetical protein
MMKRIEEMTDEELKEEEKFWSHARSLQRLVKLLNWRALLKSYKEGGD